MPVHYANPQSTVDIGFLPVITNKMGSESWHAGQLMMQSGAS